MKIHSIVITFLGGLLLGSSLLAAPVYETPAKPFSSSSYLKSTAIQKVDPARGKIQIPLITWAADGLTIDANQGMSPQAGSPLAKAMGVPAELKVIDNFDQQVQDYISGRSPFLRGTVGMISMVNEALADLDPGLKPVVIYQHSWSTGADGFVAKDIKTLSDLKGKSIVVQKNGPHIDMLQVLLQDAGLSPAEVTLKYVQDITAVQEKTVRDPAGAFREDASLTGAACIYPDLLTLTAGGKVGTGAEDSVKGARPILTTRTASRVIADVYAVRSDFFQSHRELVHGFVLQLLRTQAEFQKELANISLKSKADKAQVKRFKKRCRPLAAFALQDEGAVGDFIAWIGLDSELVGFEGNRDFFASKKNPVGYQATATRSATYFKEVGFLQRGDVPATAGWNYASDFSGLLSGNQVAQPAKPAFASTSEVRQAAASSDASELFRYTFQFPANTSEIKWQDHRDVFQTLHEKVSRYGGAVVQLRGHADNFFYNFVQMKRKQGAKTFKRRKPGTNQFIEKPLPKLEQLIGSGNRLSYDRAFSVKRAYAKYLREGLSLTSNEIDLSRFDVKGMGVSDPIHSNPTKPAERAANMRGEMVIFAVESEISLDFGLDDLQ